MGDSLAGPCGLKEPPPPVPQSLNPPAGMSTKLQTPIPREDTVSVAGPPRGGSREVRVGRQARHSLGGACLSAGSFLCPSGARLSSTGSLFSHQERGQEYEPTLIFIGL